MELEGHGVQGVISGCDEGGEQRVECEDREGQSLRPEDSAKRSRTSDSGESSIGALDTSLSEVECAELRNVANQEIEVRWMASGETVCLVSASPVTQIAQVKAQIQDRSGVPVGEQRLFIDNSGSQELQAGETVNLDGFAPPLLLWRSVTEPRSTNLGHFRPKVSFPEVPAGSFRVVRRVAQAIYGSVYEYDMTTDDVGTTLKVAVKKMDNMRITRCQSAETDERIVHIKMRGRADFEDALTEMGVLTYLSRQPDLPLYLLRMHGVYADARQTWLVTEFADGGEMFAVAASGRPIPEAQVQQHSWQLLQAVDYLHQHGIGHRDISLENILLKDGNIRLMDFGMAVQSHTSSGTALRYFCLVGKDFYRAPECYVPAGSEVLVVAPAATEGHAPGDIATVASGDYLCEVLLPVDAQPSQICKAELWGYAVQPADVFASGVAMLILGVQVPPWRRAVLNDFSFDFVRRNGDEGVSALLRSWGKTPMSTEAMDLLSRMLRPESAKRPTAAECLAHPWFAALSDMAVPTH